ncbi:hypothetical protein VTO42DRAFT_1255 [Malbranchea cinnamomea]
MVNAQSSSSSPSELPASQLAASNSQSQAPQQPPLPDARTYKPKMMGQGRLVTPSVPKQAQSSFTTTGTKAPAGTATGSNAIGSNGGGLKDIGRARVPQFGKPNLRETTEYKRAARKWTSGMVALPIFLFTSYLLYQRVFHDRERRHLVNEKNPNGSRVHHQAQEQRAGSES